jgi:biopolymer transport protein ExbD
VLPRRRARVEIIPLIDGIFCLLATFVLFTPSMNMIRVLPVVVTLRVSGEGAVYWNRELIERTEVPGRLEHDKTQTDAPRVIITGDEHARFGAMIAVYDEVRKAGITRVSVETKPRPTGK